MSYSHRDRSTTTTTTISAEDADLDNNEYGDDKKENIEDHKKEEKDPVHFENRACGWYEFAHVHRV